MFRKAMALCLVLCLCLVFGAVIFRIYIAEHYPKDAAKMVFTDALTAHYRQDEEGFSAYTQDIRFPYDDNKDGNFFAGALIVVPDASHLQVTVRYNESTLDKMAVRYALPTVPDAADGLFRYTLTVSYNTSEAGDVYQTYEPSYQQESDAYMYHYEKLAFDGVVFDGAAWMRVDIYFMDQSEPLGHICVFEARASNGEIMVDMPLDPYRIKKGELPK